MKNIFIHLLKGIILYSLLMFVQHKCLSQSKIKDCNILAQEYNNINSLRQSLQKNKNYEALDSLYTSQINLFDVHCPCSKKSGEVTWRKADLQFGLNKRIDGFQLLTNKIEKCRLINDSTTLFLLGRRALYHLRFDDYFNMKRDLDEAILIGEQKFYPGYKDLFVARCNLGLYYQWKRDKYTALNIHIQNERDIENLVFTDTSARIDNFEHIRDIALEMDDQNIVETYTGRLNSLVKGSRFESGVFNRSNEALLDYFVKREDFNKAEYYFTLVDTLAYNDYFRALPLIRYLILTGKSEEALRRLDHLDVIFEQKQIPKHHFARVNVALERFKVKNIDEDFVFQLTTSIYNNYINLINVAPKDQNRNIQTVSDKFSAVIHRLIDRDKKEFLPIVYDRLHNIKNASSAYYPKISRMMEQSHYELLKSDFDTYKRLCTGLISGIKSDSLSLFTSKIQNRLYDLGIKWHSNIKLTEVQEKLTNNEVFLDFYQGEKINGKEEYYLFVISRDQVGFVHYKNVADTLALQFLSSNYVNNSKKNKALYDYLIKPVEPYLVEKQKIYLSLDGALNQISLNILSPVGSKDKIFGDQFELRYIENSKSFFENQFRKEDKSSYLIAGGIQYDCNETPDILASNDRKTDFDRSKNQYLEGSKREIDLITAKLKKKNITLKSFSGCTASKGNIFPAMEEGEITNIHISTHGISNKAQISKDSYFSNNHQSQLLLAKANQQDDDASLSAIEIINQNHTNKNLVFLSACNTGIGTYMAGFGNASVANAFKKAGARQVVATLWPIPDDVTVLLCDYFYDHYLTNHDANEALKFAQNQLKKQGFPPEKWAAFRVMN